MPETKTTTDKEHHKDFRCDRYAKMIQRQKMLRECKPLNDGLSALARAKVLLSEEKAVRSGWTNCDLQKSSNLSERKPCSSLLKTEPPAISKLAVKPLDPSSSLTSISYTSNIVFPTLFSANRTSSLNPNTTLTTVHDASLPSASSPVKTPQHALLHKTYAFPINSNNTVSANKMPGADLTFDSLPTLSFASPKWTTSTPIASPEKSTLFGSPKKESILFEAPKNGSSLFGAPKTQQKQLNPTTKSVAMSHAFGPSISSNSTDSKKFSFGSDKTPGFDSLKETKSIKNTPTDSLNDGSLKPPETVLTSNLVQANPVKSDLPAAVRWVRYQRTIYTHAMQKLRPFLANSSEAEFRNTLRIEIGNYIDHTLVKGATNKDLAEFSNFFREMLQGNAVACRVCKNNWFNFNKNDEMHMAFLNDIVIKRIFQMVSQDPTIIETATILHGLLASHLPHFKTVFRTYLANNILLINLTIHDTATALVDRLKKHGTPLSVQSLPFERNLLRLFFTIEAASPVVEHVKKVAKLEGLQLIYEFSNACQLPQVPVMTGVVLLEILQCAGTALTQNNCPYQRFTLNNLIPRLRALPNESVTQAIEEICNYQLINCQAALTQMHNVVRQKIIDKLATIELKPL